MERKKVLRIIGFFLSVAVAALSAYNMMGRIRLVDVLTLFFGGFGVGVTTAIFIRDWKEKK
jgi:hypothetical protein